MVLFELVIGLLFVGALFALWQREALTDLRSRHVIGDDAFHVVEEELDLLDLTADTRVRPALDGTTT